MSSPADWDRIAPRYDQAIRLIERGFMAPSRRWVAARAQGRVLELAIGTGLNLPYYRPGTEVVGLDFSPGMLRHLHGHPDALVLSDAAHLPFADASFDGVVATFLLCSVQSVQAVIDEVVRVVRPGGDVLFADHVSGWWLARPFQWVLEMFTGRHGEHWLRRPLREVRGTKELELVETRRTRLGVIEALHARRVRS